MANIRTYIQQIRKNGSSYTKGSVVDLLESFKIVCQEFPFELLPQPKPLPSRDWPDEDGLDVFIPAKRAMKEYDIDVDFLYLGTDATIRNDLKDFIKFLYGLNDGAVGGALAVYNEHTGIGRKDVVVQEVKNELFTAGDEDPDAVAKIRVKFSVYDPVTDVVPVYSMVGGVRKVTQFSF